MRRARAKDQIAEGAEGAENATAKTTAKTPASKARAGGRYKFKGNGEGKGAGGSRRCEFNGNSYCNGCPVPLCGTGRYRGKALRGGF